MTQQVFADFIGTTSSTLSGIFNGRTRPTLSIVEAIKKKIPNINTDWIMFGSGQMLLSTDTPVNHGATVNNGPTPQEGQPRHHPSSPASDDLMIDFEQPANNIIYNEPLMQHNLQGMRNARNNLVREEVKNIDKPQRKVTEIRVYYDDQTWESFVPSKK